MIFAFDLDDTLSDTNAFSEGYILQFFKEHNLPYRLVSSNVRYAEAKFDWDFETAKKWYLKYNDEMSLLFPMKPGVRNTLNRLSSQGHKIVIVTARSTDWHADPEGITRVWLNQNKLAFHEIHFGREDKELVCESIGADVFVDDDLEKTANVANHLKGKTKVFLMESDYNKGFQTPEGVIRIKSIDQILIALNISPFKSK